MKKWAVLALLSGAMFIIVIDTTMMNVSISALVADLATTVSGIQAAISIYAHSPDFCSPIRCFYSSRSTTPQSRPALR